MSDEWVISMSRGDDLYLTENQHAFLMDNMNEKVVMFDHVTINPAYFVSAHKRPIEALLEMYPCQTCDQSGVEMVKKAEGIWDKVTCTKCKGTKVDFT